MNIKEQISELVSKVKSTKQVTLSGRIIVSTYNMNSFLQVNDNLFVYLKSVIQSISSIYPYIKFETQNGISEINIKLFMYNKTLFNDNFLEELKINLEILLKKIYEFEGVYARLNVIVEEQNFKEIDKYIYLNNKTVVDYKNTACEIKKSWILNK